MKEQTTQEKIEELQEALGNDFFQAGKLQYQIDCLEAELGELNIKMRNLNKLGADLQKKLAKEKLTVVEEVKDEQAKTE